MIALRVFAVTLLAAIVAIVGLAPQPTEASWVRGSFARGTFTAGVTQPPGALGCSGGGTFIFGNTPPTVTFTWAAPATPANALPITDYYWTLTQGATLVTSGTSTAAARSAAILGVLLGTSGCSVP